MAEPYFQWQNEFLLKTIYPLREMKLIDFLVSYREIELWEEYKDRPLASLQEEIDDYVEAQAQVMVQAAKSFSDLRDYFFEEVQPKSTEQLPREVVDEYARINHLHTAFKTYLPDYHNIRKEKIFVAQRVTEWEAHRKEVAAQARKRQLAGQTTKDQALALADAELSRLYELLAIYNKIDKRRSDLTKPREDALKQKQAIESVLNPLKGKVSKQQAKLKETQDMIRRLKAPPSLQIVEQHFSVANVSDQIRQIFQGVDVTLFNRFSGIRKTLNLIVTRTQGLPVKLVFIKTEITKMKRFRDDLENKIAVLEVSLVKLAVDAPQRVGVESTLGKLREIDLNAVVVELNQLSDLQTALEFATQTSQQWEGTLRAKEEELINDQAELSRQTAQLDELEKKLSPLKEFLEESKDDNLMKFSSGNPIKHSDVKVEDIVKAELEKYRKELAEKEHLELLEAVVQRFLACPEDYPLWLQYMVIHFSGMRYASAHGSWADPKDLLINLGTSFIADDFKTGDDDWIQARCDEKVECYGEPEKTLSEQGRILPRLMQVLDPKAKTLEPRAKWLDRIEDHLKALRSTNPYQRRKALLDLLIDESTYEIESMTPNAALETLKAMKDFLELPQWMWNEIVKLTELRTTQVAQDNWEAPITLTPKELKDPDLSKYREMMNKWKQGNLTSWREAHEETDRLIVTRAVCNEVAEHIQHLRGYRGGAGLTSKPDWYTREEKRFGKLPSQQQDNEHPYFIKPKDITNYKNDFQVGASILWLRFVNEEPSPWQIAKPLQTRQGDRLVPPHYWSRKGDTTNKWIYSEGKAVERHRTFFAPGKTKGSRQHQWLRWIHEATVAKVAVTADGPIVLTFETALPNEDRRLSTIGIFKRQVDDLLNDMGEDGYNATFVGFVPEGKVSAEDLDEFADDPEKYVENQQKFVENLEYMLDWNKILLRKVMSDEQLEEYRDKYIRSKIPTAPPVVPPREERTVMAKKVTDMHIKNVAGRPAPLRAWRVKFDWEGLAEYKGGVRDIAPDPCVFRCGELENNRNGHYVALTREWQFFWFDLCSGIYYGRYHRDLTKAEHRWLALRWTNVGASPTAFTNFHGLEKFRNYVLNESMDMELPKIYTLICGGATLTGTVVKNSKGVDMLKVDHFDGTKPPPPVETIDPYNDPRVFFANIITAKRIPGKAGFKVVQFPQFRGKDVPVPLLANTDIYYPLSDLEEITTGIKPPAYYR